MCNAYSTNNKLLFIDFIIIIVIIITLIITYILLLIYLNHFKYIFFHFTDTY